MSLILADLLGITGLFVGFTTHIENNKEAVIFVLAALYATARLIYYVISRYIAIRRELIELRELEKKKAE